MTEKPKELSLQDKPNKPADHPKKPGRWSKLGSAIGTAIGEAFSSR